MIRKANLGVQKRIAIFLIAVFGCMVLLVGRLLWIQVVQQDRLAERAKNQLKDSRQLQSPRGTIYDRYGRELAVSTLTKSLYANPSEIKDPDTTAAVLAPLLGVKPEDIKERISGGGQFIWLKRRLEPAVSDSVKAAIKEHDLKGLEFQDESKRYYPNDRLAAQVLGFVGTDDNGLDGLEMTLDKVVKGSLAEHWVDTDSRGVPIFQSIFRMKPPKQGKEVYLTLDATIQFIVEQALDKAMVETKARAASVIIMNPRTGEILAMANRPTYNPNEFYKFSDQEWKNRAVSYNYEPGSTFKSIIAAAALQEKVVQPDERFIDNGYIEVSGRRIQNWSGDSYGNIGFLDVIKNSINTSFAQIGMRLGAQRLIDYAKAFGFGQRTGIMLPGEEAGLLFDPKNMRDSDVATMSIGQSIAVTPLQLITGVAAIANDGVLLKPHIIKEIRNADGTVDSSASTETVRQVISPATAHSLAALMEKVVSEGGGKRAAVKGYSIAGKTGTAQKLNEQGGGYYEGRYISSFVGFAPIEDPQLVVLVVLDDPSGIYYGGEIAAPVAGEIFTQVFRHLNILPHTGTGVVPPLPPDGQPAPIAPPPVPQQLPAIPAGKAMTPSVIGKTLRDVGKDVTQAGLALVPYGTGVAVRQSPPPYTIVDPGSEVTVYFEAR